MDQEQDSEPDARVESKSRFGVPFPGHETFVAHCHSASVRDINNALMFKNALGDPCTHHTEERGTGAYYMCD